MRSFVVYRPDTLHPVGAVPPGSEETEMLDFRWVRLEELGALAVAKKAPPRAGEQMKEALRLVQATFRERGINLDEEEPYAQTVGSAAVAKSSPIEAKSAPITPGESLGSWMAVPPLGGDGEEEGEKGSPWSDRAAKLARAELEAVLNLLVVNFQTFI